MNEVRPGDKIIKSAEDHNDTARVVNHFKQYGLPAPLSANGGNQSSVSHNGSGAAVPRYWIMAISADLFAPAEVEDALDPACQFAQRVQYELVTVDPAKNQFLCVTEQLIDEDGYGRVTLSGVMQLKIDIKDAAHKYAVLKTTQPTIDSEHPQPAQLESAASGTFRIVSQPLNSEATPATGEQWCTAFFPAASGGAEITLGIVQAADAAAHTLTYKSLALLSDVSQTPNITGIGTVSASIPYVVVR